MPNEAAPDHPGVIAKPPYIYFGFLLAGALCGFFYPLPLADKAGLARIAGAILLAAGVLLMSLCVRRFNKAGTNIPTNLPVNALVTEGPYRFSRNPIYVSMTAIYVGLGLLLDNGWIIALLIPLLLIMRYGVIAREERYLETRFGDPYRDYKTRVRRWL